MKRTLLTILFLALASTVYAGGPSVPEVLPSNTAYDATSWNGNPDAATKDAIRDKIETVGGAPVDAKYIVQTADGTLSAEQATGALASGIVYNTTSTGVLSIATAGTDYEAAIPYFSVDAEGAMSLVPANAGTPHRTITITPANGIGTEDHYIGLKIDGAALDPAGVDGFIRGIVVDLSGVTYSTANTPNMAGVRLKMAVGEEALRVVEGKIVLNYTPGSEHFSTFTAIDSIIQASTLSSSSDLHILDVSIADGAPSGTVVAIGTHEDIDVIHQHVGSWVQPDQAGADSECARLPDGGSYDDGLDGLTILAAADDSILVGSSTADGSFDEIQIILSAYATKDPFLKWYYYNGAWVEFIPGDDTNGFNNDGVMRWDADNLTGWDNNYDPDAGNSAAGYWIKIERNRVATPGTITITTLKTLSATEYSWDKDGAISAESLGVTGTITGKVTTTTQTAEYTMTRAMQNGGIVLMTVANDINLLDAEAGDSFKVIVRDTAETVSIRPDAGDTIIFPGIAPVLDASDELDSPGGAQDELVCQCIAAGTWYCNGTAGWTDGGAGN